SEPLQREEPELRPEFAGYGDGHAPAVDRRLDAKRLPNSRARVGGRHAHLGSEVVGILPVFWNSATCSCSLSKPYISESGVGGHVVDRVGDRCEGVGRLVVGSALLMVLLPLLEVLELAPHRRRNLWRGRLHFHSRTPSR